IENALVLAALDVPSRRRGAARMAEDSLLVRTRWAIRMRVPISQRKDPPANAIPPRGTVRSPGGTRARASGRPGALADGAMARASPARHESALGSLVPADRPALVAARAERGRGHKRLWRAGQLPREREEVGKFRLLTLLWNISLYQLDDPDHEAPQLRDWD